MEHRENARSTYKNIQGGDIVGIYIPNMEKPKSCKECEFFCIEFYMGENKMGSACTLNDDDGSTIEADYNSCPLIEIDDEIWEALKPKVETMSFAKRGWITDDSNT